MKVLEVYDDLDWAMDETKVLAPHTVVITYEVRTFNPDTGQMTAGEKLAFELDLGDEHLKVVDTAMAELNGAGRPVAAVRPSPLPPPAQKPDRIIMSDYLYKRSLRQWVDDHKIQHPDVADLPAYIRFPFTDNPKRKNQYPDWLKKRFEKATGIVMEVKEK